MPNEEIFPIRTFRIGTDIFANKKKRFEAEIKKVKDKEKREKKKTHVYTQQTMSSDFVFLLVEYR